MADPNPYSPIKPIPGTNLVFVPAGAFDRERTKADTGSPAADFVIDFVRKGRTTEDTIVAKMLTANAYTKLLGTRAGLVGFAIDSALKGVLEKPFSAFIEETDFRLSSRVGDLIDAMNLPDQAAMDDALRVEGARRSVVLFLLAGTDDVLVAGPKGVFAGPASDFASLTADQARAVQKQLGIPVVGHRLTVDDVDRMTFQAQEKALKLMDEFKGHQSTDAVNLQNKLRYTINARRGAENLFSTQQKLANGLLTRFPMERRDP